MSAFPVLVGGALLVVAQQPPQPPSTFRAATELVEVDVRVFDEDGTFVTTLASDDFELSEDGVLRPIDLLSLVSGAGTSIVPPRGTPTERSPTPADRATRQTWIFVFDVRIECLRRRAGGGRGGTHLQHLTDDSLGCFNLGRAYSMRYFKSQRDSGSRGTWVGNARDRDLAAAHFQKYLALGGPYEQQAEEALAALAWR